MVINSREKLYEFKKDRLQQLPKSNEIKTRSALEQRKVFVYSILESV